MYRWLLFLHIAGVAFWLGSMSAVFILQRKSLRTTAPESAALAQTTTRSIVRGIVNPCSLVVLITGIIMIVQMGLGQNKPLWLSIMEMGGGMLVLISVALLSWQMRKMNRSDSDQDRKLHLGRLTNSMAGISIGVLAIILVVALRI